MPRRKRIDEQNLARVRQEHPPGRPLPPLSAVIPDLPEGPSNRAERRALAKKRKRQQNRRT
jgi:hypothetical protein